MENGFSKSLMPKTDNNSGKELASAHWKYVENVICMDLSIIAGNNLVLTKKELIDMIKFHYESAFIHGYKHAKEDK